jgi:transcriptional regulator with XRE-family HTH domain
MSERSRDTVSEKIDHLFHTVRRPDGREFTYDEVEQGTAGRVSRSYVWKLRHGRNRNPSLDVIEALSEFFGVPPLYFFDAKERDEAAMREATQVAALLHDPSARTVAERSRGLSPASVTAVLDLVDNLRAVESSVRRAARTNGVAA